MLPYIHRTSRNLKKVTGRHDVSMVVSAPRKLAKLCSKISSAKKGPGVCGMKHGIPYVACTVGVVYEIPLSCGKCYVGQTGR